MTFHEERCRVSGPSPRPPVCDDCEEPYGDDDLRIKHKHWRVGIITICETCAGPIMAEGLAEGLMAVFASAEPEAKRNAA